MKKLTQWHPAFCSAMKLELMANKADLEYLSEVGLNTKPILLDFLVIKKKSDVLIRNEIGRFFRNYNIFEYKSPRDALNIDDFYKGVAYACLYKTTGRKVNDIKAEDLTLTFVRNSKPRKLFAMLSEEGLVIEPAARGIYRLKSSYLFDIQIIVSGELAADSHIWLHALKKDLSMQEAEIFIKRANVLSDKDDKEFMDSVFQVVLSENISIFTEMREVPLMCEALRSLMQDVIVAEVNAAVADKDAEIEAKDAEIEAKDAEIARLKAQLGRL